MSEIPAFILEGRCRYRNGEAARVLATDVIGDFPIVTCDGEGAVRRHAIDGSWGGKSHPVGHDLVEIPAESAKPREVWINEYAGSLYTLAYKTETDAFKGAQFPAKQVRLVEVPPGWSDPRPPEIGPPQIVKDFLELRGTPEFAEAMRSIMRSGEWKTEIMGESKPLPPGIPQPPDGFEYYGHGKVKRDSWTHPSPDIAQYDAIRNSWWIVGARGSSPLGHYALRIGSEIHRLNTAKEGA